MDAAGANPGDEVGVMNALLDLAITAHGGLDRWNKVTSIKVDTSITGAIWYERNKSSLEARLRQLGMA